MTVSYSQLLDRKHIIFLLFLNWIHKYSKFTRNYHSVDNIIVYRLYNIVQWATKYCDIFNLHSVPNRHIYKIFFSVLINLWWWLTFCICVIVMTLSIWNSSFKYTTKIILCYSYDRVNQILYWFVTCLHVGCSMIFNAFTYL